MYDVAIIGAGELGGVLAHVLARRDVVGTIRLIDTIGTVAQGKALDILQASPIAGFATRVTGGTDLTYAGGATIVVLADRAGGSEWQGDEGLLMLRQLALLSRHAIVICAGALQRELIERGVRELGFRVDQLFGSAPEALAAAVRSLVALEVNGSAKDVALTILGVPPSHTIIPWESVTVGGFSANDVLSEPSRRRIIARVAPLWPPGPYSLATVAAEAIAAITGQSQRTLSCFVAPDDAQGRRARAAALPVRLSAAGVASVALPVLDAGTQVALDTALLL
jgi:malate dehydrogenase